MIKEVTIVIGVAAGGFGGGFFYDNFIELPWASKDDFQKLEAKVDVRIAGLEAKIDTVIKLIQKPQ